jgi:hypothetical protein
MTQALDSSTTGGLANTRVTNERHTFTGTGNIKPVVTSKGAAYWQDIEVINVSTGIALIKDTDYKPLDLCSIPTKISGKQIYSSLVVIKPGVSSVDISYSTPTDFEAASGVVNSLANLLTILTAVDRKTWWNDIQNRPVLFDPSFHRHNLSKSTGYEYLINTLDQLIKVMILGDEVGHDQIREYIDTQLALHFNSLVSEFTDLNNSTNEVLGAINTRMNSNNSSVLSLITKLDTLVANQSTYQSVLSTLPAAVTSSQTSANTWSSALAF